MGTRSTYRVIEKWTDVRTGEKGQNKFVLMYVQYDGYPEGHPLETAKWLSQGTPQDFVKKYSKVEEHA